MRDHGADAADHGTVWITEDVDSTESLLLTGRFSGYLDRDGYGLVAGAEVFPHRPGKPVSGPVISY